MEELLRPFDLQLFSEEEKTEEATPRRRQEARKKGQVAKSNELNAAVNLLAILVLFIFASDFIFHRALSMVQEFYLEFLGTPVEVGQVSNLLLRFMGDFFIIMSPIFATALVSGLIANYVQVGFLVSSESMQFNFNKLNPLEGFKKIVSRRAAVELVKGLAKICLVGYLVYAFIRGELEGLVRLIFAGAEAGYATVSSLFITLGFRIALLFLFLALLDYTYQRYEFNKSLKMSKYEVKQEYRQMEGDPHLKAKLRQKQREVSTRQMMQEVPEATVVITNPTELAVALKYDPGEQVAPLLVAKGAGFIAQGIRETAREHYVPVVENPPVAQMLYRYGEVGREIPVEMYQAVAEILAAVMRVRA